MLTGILQRFCKHLLGWFFLSLGVNNIIYLLKKTQCSRLHSYTIKGWNFLYGMVFHKKKVLTINVLTWLHYYVVVLGE